MLFTLLKLVIILFYFGFGIMAMPSIIKDLINDGILIENYYYIVVYILSFVILITYTLLKKNLDNNNIIDMVKRKIIFTFPFYYALVLITGIIFKKDDIIGYFLFTNGKGVVEDVLGIIITCSVYSTLPIIISSIIEKIRFKKLLNKEYEKEILEQAIKEEKKSQKEKANLEIEYYKKLDEIKTLLKNKTIDQNKFNEMKNTLDRNYEIDNNNKA